MYRIGIFVPVYFREKLAIESLNTLANNTFINSSIDVFLFIGINGARIEFKNFLDKYIKENINNKFKHIEVFNAGKNIGKPKIVNIMSFTYNNMFDYLVSMDSDIQITENKWIFKFLEVFHLYDRKPQTRRLGALCANQIGNSVHQAEKLGKMSLKLDNYTLVTTPTNQGVAGGLLMTPKHVWNEIKGYRASNIYGSDDGAYAIYCNKANYIMAYVEEINCYHPKEENIKYAEWKVRSCNGELKKEEKPGFFEYLRHESI